MGLANLVPGISGGTLALTLGIYEEFITALGDFFTAFKKSFKFLLPVGIGIVLSLLTLSRVIDFGLTNYLFATIMLFVGAILGGIPMLYKKTKGEKVGVPHFLSFILSGALVLATVFLAGENQVSFENLGVLDYVVIFLVGIIASLTMIVPGISGSAVLMTIGYYAPIIETVKNLTDMDKLFSSVVILAPFGIGVLVGMLGGAKFIEKIIHKYPFKAYWGVLGFVIASIVAIIYQNFFSGGIITVGAVEVVVGIIFFAIAMIGAYKFAEK